MNRSSPDLYMARSLVALFRKAVTSYPQRTALEEGPSAITYGTWDALSRSWAAYAQSALGLKRGERIAMMCPNTIAFPVGMLGTLRAGGVQVNVNPMYSVPELVHQLQDAEAGIVMVHRAALPTLEQALAQVPVRVVVVMEDDPREPTTPELLARAPTGVQFLSFARCLDEGANLAFVDEDLQPQDLAFLQYTGGTTGLSKGAMLTHGNLLANIGQFLRFAQPVMSNEGEVIITALPLYHIFSLMVNTLSYMTLGATNVLVADPRDMAGFVQLLQRRAFTAITGVNTLYVGLMAQPGFAEVDFSRFRVAWGGGAPIPPATSERWKSFSQSHIKLGYGLSETSPILTLNPVHLPQYTDTVGVPLPDTEIVLVDGQGRAVATGERGEIWVRGPQVMQAYWRNPEASAEVMTPDGFFKTGDIGTFDADGFLRIVDRKKDMVLVSGFNVYPAEVEAAALAFPGVRECAAVSVPDDKTGEAVKLYFSALPGVNVDPVVLLQHCRAHLAAYKVPRQIEQLPDLPKSTVGKILRRSLRT